MPSNLFVPENSFLDRINGLQAFLDTFSVLYPQLQSIDFRSEVPSLDVPVCMVIGQHEARGRAVLANEWYQMLEAPSKERSVFEPSGHRPLFEEPAVFASLMTTVLDDTYAGSEQGTDYGFACASDRIERSASLRRQLCWSDEQLQSIFSAGGDPPAMYTLENRHLCHQLSVFTSSVSEAVSPYPVCHAFGRAFARLCDTAGS